MDSDNDAGHSCAAQPPLTHVTWRTAEPLQLSIGFVHACGHAAPQVRSPQKLAELGDRSVQAAKIQEAIVAALRDILVAMEPAADQLADLTDELASATLVAANTQLGGYGICLLDLTVDEWQPSYEREEHA